MKAKRKYAIIRINTKVWYVNILAIEIFYIKYKNDSKINKYNNFCLFAFSRKSNYFKPRTTIT